MKVVFAIHVMVVSSARARLADGMPLV